MASPTARRGAGVSIVLSPPIEFILRQSGAFRRALLVLTPLWERFERVLSEVGKERFDSEGYGEWQGLAASTIDQRIRLGFGAGPILRRTGDLRDSLVDPARASRKSPRTMTWASDSDYAGYHQDGGSIPGRPPQRVVLELRVEDRRRLETQMVSWVNEIAARTFGRI